MRQECEFRSLSCQSCHAAGHGPHTPIPWPRMTRPDSLAPGTMFSKGGWPWVCARAPRRGVTMVPRCDDQYELLGTDASLSDPGIIMACIFVPGWTYHHGLQRPNVIIILIIHGVARGHYQYCTRWKERIERNTNSLRQGIRINTPQYFISHEWARYWYPPPEPQPPPFPPALPNKAPPPCTLSTPSRTRSPQNAGSQPASHKASPPS